MIPAGRRNQYSLGIKTHQEPAAPSTWISNKARNAAQIITATRNKTSCMVRKGWFKQTNIEKEDTFLTAIIPIPVSPSISQSPNQKKPTGLHRGLFCCSPKLSKLQLILYNPEKTLRRPVKIERYY